MSACSAQSFTGITPAVMSCCVSAANSHGASIPNPPPPTGNVSVNSFLGTFTFTWNYNAAAQTATLQCTDSPWEIRCSTIENAITGTVTGCGGQPA